MKCATHPNVETNLRCGKCGKLICPNCMVQTPVGARCTECARMHKLPTYSVSTSYYLRATGTALGMALACGLAWGFLGVLLPFYLNLLLAPAAGYAIGEVISRSVNRKRGTGLALVAGTAVVISYLVSVLLLGGLPFVTLSLLHSLIDLAALALGISVTAARLR